MNKKSTPFENAQLFQTNFTVLLGEFSIVFNPPFVHIACNKPSRATAAWLGLPSLCAGARAAHLTIPLEPMRHGEHAGKLHVHLTYNVEGEHRHKTIAYLDPATIVAKVESFTEQLLSYTLRNTRRVSVDDLQREGYLVTLLGDAAKQKLGGVLFRRRSKYRLNRDTMTTLLEHIDVYDLAILDQLREQPVYLIRQADGATLTVCYLKDGLGPEHPAGWYAMPRPEACVDLMLQVLGPSVIEAFTVISTELQWWVNREALQSVYARALGPASAAELSDSAIDSK